MAVLGGRGSGKSAFLAALAGHFEEAGEPAALIGPGTQVSGDAEILMVDDADLRDDLALLQAASAFLILSGPPGFRSRASALGFAIVTLEPFEVADVASYLPERLREAGFRITDFTSAVPAALVHASGGVPGPLNRLIGSSALFAGMAGDNRITAEHVEIVATDLRPRRVSAAPISTPEAAPPEPREARRASHMAAIPVAFAFAAMASIWPQPTQPSRIMRTVDVRAPALLAEAMALVPSATPPRALEDALVDRPAYPPAAQRLDPPSPSDVPAAPRYLETQDVPAPQFPELRIAGLPVIGAPPLAPVGSRNEAFTSAPPTPMPLVLPRENPLPAAEALPDVRAGAPRQPPMVEALSAQMEKPVSPGAQAAAVSAPMATARTTEVVPIVTSSLASLPPLSARRPGLLPESSRLRLVVTYPRGDADSARHAADTSAAISGAGWSVGEPFAVVRGPSTLSLRYFYEEDVGQARQLAQGMAGPAPILVLTFVPSATPLPRPGTFELALPASLASRRPLVATVPVPQLGPSPPVPVLIEPQPEAVLRGSFASLRWRSEQGWRSTGLLEVVALDDPASPREVHAGFTDGAQQQRVPLRPGRYAWRVTALSRYALRYSASDWSAFTVEGAAP